jgi:DNA-binding Lrp family transcriptional regulator
MHMNLSQTKKDIVKYITSHGVVSVKQLVDAFGISKQAMHRHLKELQDAGELIKRGSPPKVYYSSLQDFAIKEPSPVYSVEDSVVAIIEDNFQYILPQGYILTGFEGFVQWCSRREYNVAEFAQKYAQTFFEYRKYYDGFGLINATIKLKNTFMEHASLDGLYYGSFSTWEIFGKTKMYQNLLYSKTNQSKYLIETIVAEARSKVENILRMHNIQAVGYISPTVKRETQLMAELRRRFDIPLPHIRITKINNEIAVPQKTLKTLEERQLNAQSTFVVDATSEASKAERILLIDDFVGSGSSLNEVGYKLRSSKEQLIIGFALCGSPNGVVNHSKKFEVVSEV